MDYFMQLWRTNNNEEMETSENESFDSKYGIKELAEKSTFKHTYAHALI